MGFVGLVDLEELLVHLVGFELGGGVLVFFVFVDDVFLEGHFGFHKGKIIMGYYWGWI